MEVWIAMVLHRFPTACFHENEHDVIVKAVDGRHGGLDAFFPTDPAARFLSPSWIRKV
jgi:hypothetical protein